MYYAQTQLPHQIQPQQIQQQPTQQQIPQPIQYLPNPMQPTNQIQANLLGVQNGQHTQ